MNRSLNHPSLSGGAVLGEVDRAPALLYRDVCEAYEDLDTALEQHEPLAATEAALRWWDALERLMQR